MFFAPATKSDNSFTAILNRVITGGFSLALIGAAGVINMDMFARASVLLVS